jgi:ubiquinone/menaquinone biosynthesis C-methylase UbiE
MLNSIWRRLRAPRRPATLSSLDAYERWAEQYPPHAHNALMQAEQNAMMKLCPSLAGKRVLDLACGSGRYGLIALSQGAAVTVGLDNSAAMLKQNQHFACALSTTEKIPLASGSVDIVLCGMALGHLKGVEASLFEIGRVLKRGGCALISDFHPFIFLNGQQRTFTAPDGQTFAVEHYVHLYADYHRAGQTAGLKIDAVLEPRLGQEADVRFAEADTRTGTPVIISYRFVREADTTPLVS